MISYFNIDLVVRTALIPHEKIGNLKRRRITLWKAYFLESSIEEAKKQEMRLRRPALHWHLKSGWEKIAANHVLIFLSYVWQVFLVIKRNMICSMSYVNWNTIRYECPIFFWSVSCMNDGQRGILQSLDLRLFLQFEAAITEYIQLALHSFYLSRCIT